MKCFVFAIEVVLFSAALLLPVHGQNVTITDPALLAALRSALNQPTGPVTQQELLTLTTFAATNLNVRSAAGLTGARNLNSLYLGYNPISQFAIADGLTTLTLLDIRYCQLTLFTVSPTATSLTSLNLDDNQLSSLFLPPTLRNLNSLNLAEVYKLFGWILRD
jgi:internalin A